MLIADKGGGYGGTEWASKDVRFMWSTIANQETDPHFDVVGGWRKTADLTLAHLGQVQMYRDNLATVWPPTKSAAAAAYLARLDKLIADLQATHEAASANYTAFSTVTLTLSLARHKLKPILEQYEANEQLNLDWQAKQDAAAAKPEVLLTPVFKLPPVSSARQEELNNQARAIMYDLSSTVLSGQAALQKPKPYDPAGTKDDVDQGGSTGDSGSGFAVPPVIPPPGASSGGASGSAITPVSNSTTTPVHPPANVPGIGVGGPGSGPVLGGVGPNPVITPPTPGPPPTIGPGPVPPPAPPGLLPGVIGPGNTGPSSTGGLLPNGGRVPPSSPTKPGMGGRMAMPSGGVIGATPGSGMIGQVPPATMGPRAGGQARPNPVGGVIGQGNGPLGRPASGIHGAGGPNTPLANQARQRHERRGDTAEADSWDPDNPWVTEVGVDPIVRPPDAPGPIDPGPAIGYQR